MSRTFDHLGSEVQSPLLELCRVDRTDDCCGLLGVSRGKNVQNIQAQVRRRVLWLLLLWCWWWLLRLLLLRLRLLLLLLLLRLRRSSRRVAVMQLDECRSGELKHIQRATKRLARRRQLLYAESDAVRVEERQQVLQPSNVSTIETA